MSLNLVIESLTPDHGKEIIKFFKKLGYNTTVFTGFNSKEGNYNKRFYGVIDGKFGCYKEIDISNSVQLLKLDRAIEIFKKELNNNSTMETPAKKKRGPQPGFKKKQPVILEEKITKVDHKLGGERGKSVQQIPHTPTSVGMGSINSIPPSVSSPVKSIKKLGEAFSELKTDKEQVNHPAHYNMYPIEGIDMLVGIFGLEKTIDFCIMTAMKYRLRLGFKDDINQDLAKEKWYLDKAKELEERWKAIGGLNKTR